MDLQLDRTKTAILLMDLHPYILGHLPGEQTERLLPTIRRALDGARKCGVAVIYVAAAYRPGFLSTRNKFVRNVIRPGQAPPLPETERVKIVEPLTPQEDEAVVRKPRIGAFYGSDLQSMLMARDIDTLVLSGVATNFVVESTARVAVDLDYRVIVLEDCCTARTEEAHRAAIASMEPMVEIATAQDFLSSIGGA